MGRPFAAGVPRDAHRFDTVTERIDPEQAIRAARYGMDADEKPAG